MNKPYCLTKELRQDLESLVRYTIDNEAEDYENQVADGEDGDHEHHIFLSIKRLSQWLTATEMESAAVPK